MKAEVQAQIMPMVSEQVRDGKCPRGGGSQFEQGRANVAGSFLVGGLIGVAAAKSLENRHVHCTTCGMEWQVG